MAFKALEDAIETLKKRLAGVEKRTVPAGVVNPFAGASGSVPSGWLLADGTAVSRTEFADLFGVVGTTYGAGNGTTTFNLPNFRGRVPVGRDVAQTEFDTLGETGGAKTHTLTTTEMPAHTHTTAINRGFIWSATAGGNHFGVDNGGADNTSSAGGGGAHNNLQPYIVLNYIIKA